MDTEIKPRITDKTRGQTSVAALRFRAGGRCLVGPLNKQSSTLCVYERPTDREREFRVATILYLNCWIFKKVREIQEKGEWKQSKGILKQGLRRFTSSKSSQTTLMGVLWWKTEGAGRWLHGQNSCWHTGTSSSNPQNGSEHQTVWHKAFVTPASLLAMEGRDRNITRSCKAS